ncbi:hypothetical protein HNR37_000138 [Desulfurispira natronophila]|uniref:Uncharacterized protein n=1 Tax=Desulfurispira natronophila TaxID=682562 RepID=A0A7W8DFZ0_9BACT|nr:hypothetical protein [Desulfurispira natronophila]
MGSSIEGAVIVIPLCEFAAVRQRAEILHKMARLLLLFHYFSANRTRWSNREGRDEVDFSPEASMVASLAQK